MIDATTMKPTYNRTISAVSLPSLMTGLLGALFLSLSGCVTDNHVERGIEREAELQAINDRAENAPFLPLPPDYSISENARREAAESTVGIPENPLPTLPVEHFDMGQESDIAIVLRSLARGADLNLVLGRDVSGPIQLNIPQETTWDRLFTMIVETHSLHYEFRDGMLRVMSKADIEEQTSLERALKERERAREERQRSEPLQLELYRVRYAEATKLADSIKSSFNPTNASRSSPEQQLLGEEQTSTFSIIPDEDSGLLILNATPTQMPHLLKLAQNLDQPAYQILIEATIVQANSETARQLGMQWGVLQNAPDGGKVTVGTAANPSGFNSNFPGAFNPAATGFTFGLERLSNHQLLQAQLSALQKEGRLSIVSSPSITTLDKQIAIIESGEERPFQSAVGSGAGATPVVEFKKALLSLEVTPQVIDGNWIKLNIHTTKDDFDDSRSVIIEGTMQVPITTRSATTVLYLADGQTTVIGGLSTNSELDQEAGIPFLKDIPIFGGLFRNTNQRSVLNNTVIFITPHILPGGLPELLTPPISNP